LPTELNYRCNKSHGYADGKENVDNQTPVGNTAAYDKTVLTIDIRSHNWIWKVRP